MYMSLQAVHFVAAALLLAAPQWRQTGVILMASALWNSFMLPGQDAGGTYFFARNFADAWVLSTMVWFKVKGWIGQASVLLTCMVVHHIALLEWWSQWILLLGPGPNRYSPIMDILNVIQLILPVAGIRQGGANALAGLVLFFRRMGSRPNSAWASVVAHPQREKRT